MADSRYYLQILSLIYIILLAIVFYSKKTKVTSGSKIFSQLIFFVLLTCLLDIACVITQGTKSELLNYYLTRGFIAAIVKFVLIFTEYITIVVSGKENDEEKMELYNKVHLKSNIIYIIWCILFVYISTFYSTTQQEVGSIVTIFYCAISWVICIGYWIVIMSKYIIRKIENELNIIKVFFLLWSIFFKNLFPIAVAIVPGTIGMIIQFVNPNLHVIAPLFAFAIINMYFTIFPIENPDIELVKQIEDAKLEAENANQSKTEFLSNVSHEIRTPLNAILGFSQTLLEEDITPTVREEVEYIVSSSEALLEIVNEILDISKIASNKLEIVNVDYSIEKVYKSLVALTQERIGSSQLQFIHNYNTNIPPVLNGDFVRIKQIASNLLNNALKYTESGFIKLRFECDNIEKDKCRIIISVTDSGIGISDENLEKIFSKFEGLEVMKDIDIEGTGLGLSLTKKLVTMMDGKIVVQSIKGEGSTFTVYLTQNISDKSLDELDTEEIKTSNQTFVGNGEKILIVDDNPVNLKVALRLMKPYNLNIETLSSGKEFIAKIQAGRVYDLVMLDDMMPEMSGVETLDYLKSMGTYHMTTIALTANAISGMKEKYIKEGFNDYLAKPIDKRILEELLIRYLGNKKKKSIPTESIVEEEVEQREVDKNISIKSTNEKGNKDFLTQNGVDLNKALEFLGDMEMYDETVTDFLEEIDQKLADIEKYKNDQDMPNYAIQVHSLKSDAKYLGIMDLADIAYKHEMASKGNDIEFVNNNYDELMNLAKQKVDIIRKYNGN